MFQCCLETLLLPSPSSPSVSHSEQPSSIPVGITVCVWVTRLVDEGEDEGNYC